MPGTHRARFQPVRILDIAAGHGRYVIDAAKQLPSKPESIILRDYRDANVRAGTALLEQSGLADIATFSNGDAFDEDSLAAIAPSPTITIASGIYELIHENNKLQSSLRGLSRCIAAGS